MTKFYKFAKTLCLVFCKLSFKLKIIDSENLPTTGGFILASNHVSDFDPLIIGGPLDRQLNFMAKKELFKNKFVAKILLGLGAFPVDRGAGDNTAIDKAIDTVKNDKVLAIFPEGTRSKDGELKNFKSGAMFVAGKTKGDVVPTVVYFPDGVKFRARVFVKYGELIPHEILEIDEQNPRTIKKSSSLVKSKIQELLDSLKKEL